MRSISIILFILAFSSCTNVKNQNDSFSVVENADPQSNDDFLSSYSINSLDFGTKTLVKLTKTERIITTNALPNHPTGQFPNAGNPNTIKAQEITYKFPLKPELSGKAVWSRQPGVAINGVKFEPETAERFVCETGEVYRIEAFQDLVSLGLDSNHAHVQPTGAYHYHGVPTGLVETLDPTKDVVLVGFAMDGFPIYYSRSGKYKPSFKLQDESRTGDACSYKTPHQSIEDNFQGTRPDGTFVSDWKYEEGIGQLDECNGITINGEYVYFVTDEYPYVGRCLKGKFTEDHPKGPPPGGRPGGGDHPHPPGGRPHQH